MPTRMEKKWELILERARERSRQERREFILWMTYNTHRRQRDNRVHMDGWEMPIYSVTLWQVLAQEGLLESQIEPNGTYYRITDKGIKMFNEIHQLEIA